MFPTTTTLQRALHQLRPGDNDRHLLKRFAESRDESAFVELVRRHGPLVQGTACRVLGDSHAADDVFQSTFLLLARKAASVGWHDSVSSWLHAATVRLALKERSKLRRIPDSARLTINAAPEPEPVVSLVNKEVQGILDEELARLPRSLAEPLILCYLQGQTRDEAAETLGLTLGQLKHRLQQGRDSLRKRLSKRGVGLSAAGLGVALSRDSVSAARASTIAKSAIGHVSHIGWSIKCKLLIVAVLMIGIGTGLAVQPGNLPFPPNQSNPVPEETIALQTRPAGKLPAGVVRQFGDSRLRSGVRVEHLAFSPNGKILASWGRFMYVHDRLSLWDVATGEEIQTAITNEHHFGAMGFPADGRGYVVLKELDNSRTSINFQIVEFTARDFKLPPPDAKKYGVFVGNPGGIGQTETFERFAISPEGKWLAGIRGGTNHPTRDLAIWPLRATDSGKTLKPEKEFGNFESVASIEFTPDGKTIMAFGKTADGDKEQTLTLWDWREGKKLRELTVPRRHQGSSVAVSPDGTILAIGHGDGTARLLELATGKEIRRVGKHERNLPNGRVWAGVGMVGFTPDGKHLLTGGWDEKVLVWEVKTGKRVTELTRHHSWPEAFAASPDGSRVATGGQDSLIKIWDTQTWKSAVPQTGHTHTVWDADISGDGKLAVTSAWDGTARVWEMATGREVALIADLQYAHFTPDGTGVIGTKNGTVQLFDVKTGQTRALPEPLRDLKENAKGFSPDGKTLFTHTDDEVLLRAWPTGEVRHRLKFQKTSDGFFSPDGKILVTTASSGGATVWDAKTGEIIRVLDIKGSMYAHMAAFTPDGSGFVIESKGQNGGITLWDTRTWTVKRTFDSSDAGLSSHHYLLGLAISADGRVVATGAHDGTIALFEVATGQIRQRLFGHREGVAAMEFTPDGRFLLTGGLDHLVYLWDITPEGSGVEPKMEDVEKLWPILGETYAKPAYRAMVGLIKRPKETFALLRKELRPAIGPKPETVRDILKRLGSANFTRREKAVANLDKLGEAGVPVVRAELDDIESAEARRRAEQYIAKYTSGETSPRRLRQSRALEILEHLPGPESKSLLEELAKGQPGAWITEQAKGALRRRERTASLR